jgi:hypothetical protein
VSGLHANRTERENRSHESFQDEDFDPDFSEQRVSLIAEQKNGGAPRKSSCGKAAVFALFSGTSLQTHYRIEPTYEFKGKNRRGP